MLKLVSKFVLNIFPSVAASVIGGYIVHNYIYARPAAPVPAVTAATAEAVGGDGSPFAAPIPVSAKVVEAETPTASQPRPTPEAMPSRTIHRPARTVGERLGVARRGGHSVVLASQRERVPARGAASPVAAPVLMPALDLVPEPQRVESSVGTEVDTAAAPTRADPDRLIPRVAELALIRRLSALSSDVETMLVSQTQSAADGVVTTAKSVFHAMLPR